MRAPSRPASRPGVTRLMVALALLIPIVPNLILLWITRGAAFWVGGCLSSAALVALPLILGLELRLALWLWLPFALLAPAVGGYEWATGNPPSLLALEILREATGQELSNFLPQVALCAAAALATGALYLAAIRRTRGWRWRLRPWQRAVLAAFALALVGKDVVRQGWREGAPILAARLEKLHPTAPVVLWWNLRNGQGVIPDRQRVLEAYRVTEASPLAPREVCVLILGESARASAFGLYNPTLATTPLLSKRDDLFVFRDVKSCGTATIQAVPILLTGRFPDAGEILPFRHLGLVEAFRLAGFHTEWASSQHADGQISSFITAFSVNADEKRFLNGRLERSALKDLPERDDGALFAPLDAALEGAPRKLFIVLHTIGSHAPYVKRYPPAFERWPVDASSRARMAFWTPPFSAAQQEQLTHAYLNTVLYTDWIINEVIERLRRRGGISAVAYLSDHGDNPADAAVMPIAHAVLSHAVTTIPMLFWLSPELGGRRPALAAGLRANLGKPVSAQDLFATVCSLFTLQTGEADPALDLTRPDFRPGPRRVMLLDDEVVPAPE